MRHNVFLILLLTLIAFPAVAQKQKRKHKVSPAPKEVLLPPAVSDSETVEAPPMVQAPGEAPAAAEIYSVTEQMPQYPGGIPALTAFLSRNLVYPAKAQEAGIQGKVIVRFVVGNDGSLSDVKVVRGIGGGCDEEALRVIRKMPKWNPGKQNGKAVKVYYSQPISFRLIEEEPVPKIQK